VIGDGSQESLEYQRRR